jgi:DNA-binding response OmpR family regulator
MCPIDWLMVDDIGVGESRAVVAPEARRSFGASMPVVILGGRSGAEDRMFLLDLGVDDGRGDAANPKDLLAKVRRIMERLAGSTDTPPFTADRREIVSFGDVSVDFSGMEAHRAGRPVMLTANEFKIVRYFAKNAGRVISREELLNELWGYQRYPSTRTVDNHIMRLRHKLETDPARPQHFLTMHGAGYKFVPEGLCLARCG